MTQLENKIIKILNNLDYKNKLIEILKQYKIKDSLITDNDFLKDVIMMNPSYLFRDITKIDIDDKKLDFTSCINKYNLNDNIVIMRNSILRNGLNIKNGSSKIKNNYELVKLAVNNNGLALQYVSTKLKNNFDIVKYSINNNPDSYYFASINLKNNIDIITILLIRDPVKINEFSYIDNYKKIVKAVIKQNGLALKYAHQKFKNNKTVVTNACKNNIKALQYADEKLLIDSKFIIQLAKKLKNDQIIYYASLKLLHSKQFNIDIIRELDFNLYFVDDKFKDDFEVVEVAINNDIRYLEHASNRIRKNDIYILELIKKYGPILRYAHKDLLNNKDFMYKAIKLYNGSIKYLNNDLLNDKDFIDKIKKIDKWCEEYLNR